MGDLIKPENKIVVVGDPLHVEKKIITVANMYPGRLVRRDTSETGIKISGVAQDQVGWLGYEQCHPNHQPDDVDTIYAVNAYAPVLYGGKFVIVASLANGENVEYGAKLRAAANGEVKSCSDLDIPNGGTTVTSTSASPSVDGSVPGDGMVVAIAMEDKNASGGAADIMVLSLI